MECLQLVRPSEGCLAAYRKGRPVVFVDLPASGEKRIIAGLRELPRNLSGQVAKKKPVPGAGDRVRVDLRGIDRRPRGAGDEEDGTVLSVDTAFGTATVQLTTLRIPTAWNFLNVPIDRLSPLPG